MYRDQVMNKNIYHRIRDSAIKNYRIIRLRIEIGRIEKNKAAQYELLGKRLFRIIQTKRVELPEQKKLMAHIDWLEDLQKEKSDLLVKIIQS